MLKEILENEINEAKDLLQTVKDYKWFGNFYADSNMFKLIDMYVMKNYKKEPKISAELLRISTEKGMGIDTSKDSDEKMVKDFLDNM